MSTEQQLYDRIVEANREYRKGTPLLSDVEYDKLVSQLRSINPNHKWFQSVEPGLSLENRKVSLPFPMRSLDKVKTFNELQGWFSKVGLVESDLITVTPKYDGISLLCNEADLMTYSRGGSENEGMDCQLHMKLMTGVNHTDEPLYTFGEAIIPKNLWELHFKGQTNPLNGKPYMSARNTVAGLFRRDNPPAERMQHIRFVRYGQFMAQNSYNSYQQMLADMSHRFWDVSEKFTAPLGSFTAQQLEELFDNWSGAYNIDGLVIYMDDMDRWEQVGRHHTTGNPQWAIAYKPEEFTEAEFTTVKTVRCKVSKSGCLKPTVEVDAVELEGAVIDNPTGYNARFCMRNGIGDGAVVKLIRSGMVIPKIVKVMSRALPFFAEKAFVSCPSCGSKTVWNESHTDKVCSNKDCIGVSLAKLSYFCEKIGYDNVGEEILKVAMRSGIRTPSQWISASKEELMEIEKIGRGIASKITERNQQILTNGLSLFKLMEVSDLFEGVGEKKARQLFTDVSTEWVKQWLNGEATSSSMIEVAVIMEHTKGVGKKMVDEFVQKQEAFLSWLKQIAIPPIIESKMVTGPLSGTKVCFSGVRDKELEELITKAGGEVVNTVSKNIRCLIVADVSINSVKAQKAKTLKKPVVAIENANSFLGL